MSPDRSTAYGPVDRAGVIAIYQLLLGRDPAEEEIAGQLAQGPTWLEVLRGVVLFPEFRTGPIDGPGVTAIYELMLGRPASREEVDAQLASSPSWLGVLQGVAQFAEYRERLAETVPAVMMSAPMPPSAPAGALAPAAGGAVGGGGATARAESLAHARIGSRAVITATTDVGPLLLHAHDQVITPAVRRTGVWEPEEGAWLRAVVTPGATVVDCGANIGYFSVMAAQLAGASGRVVAIEPDAANLGLLRANLWLNRCDGVEVVPCAAGRGRGVATLCHSDHNTGDHQVHTSGAADGVLVPLVSLDELLAGARVDVIKIDVQGFDHEVMAGATAALAASPEAVVLVEFSVATMEERGVDPRAVLRDYRALGRPIGLVDGPDRVSDDEIMESAARSPGHWANLVFGPAGV